MAKNEFKFTVVIPVYMVEKYLREALDSVIAQDAGFRENIQIILVNDGSPDGSGDICKEYHDRYPDNIEYIDKENGGVSSARNAAIPFIRGKYVNFLDSDDCWEADAFKAAGEFFDSHYDETDVVGCRKEFFDARTGYHYLDYKYESSKIADLTKEASFIQLDVTGAFIKAEAIGEHRFSERLKYGEDAVFVNSILLEKRTLGVCREALHRYRKRSDESSALQNDIRDKSYYFDSTRLFLQYLLDESVKKYGVKEKFIQNTVMYELGWRIRKQGVREYLSDEDYSRYCGILMDLLREIDDDVIKAQRYLWKKHKIFCILKKHGMDAAAKAFCKVSGLKTVFG